MCGSCSFKENTRRDISGNTTTHSRVETSGRRTHCVSSETNAAPPIVKKKDNNLVEEMRTPMRLNTANGAVTASKKLHIPSEVINDGRTFGRSGRHAPKKVSDLSGRPERSQCWRRPMGIRSSWTLGTTSVSSTHRRPYCHHHQKTHFQTAGCDPRYLAGATPAGRWKRRRFLVRQAQGEHPSEPQLDAPSEDFGVSDMPESARPEHADSAEDGER